LDLPSLLRAADAQTLARYTTHRSKYAISIGGREMGIDVDEADYGFGVIEVEECVPAGGEEVAAAKERVARLARALGLLSGAAKGEGGGGLVIRGKLEEYIARKDPAHHKRLVEAGIFKG
jgi:hypothetical protein